MDAPKFSFDWILAENEYRKPALIDFYKENEWEVPLVEVRTKEGTGVSVHYEVGNPLLGGIKRYTAFNTAEKYFFELIGRIHRDAQIRNIGGE